MQVLFGWNDLKEIQTRNVTLSLRKEQEILYYHYANSKECYIGIEEIARDVTLPLRKEQGTLHRHRGKNKECYIFFEEITRSVTLSLRTKQVLNITLSLKKEQGMLHVLYPFTVFLLKYYMHAVIQEEVKTK